MTGHDEAVPAGRDLTANDVDEAVTAWVEGERQSDVVGRLNGIARPSGGAGQPDTAKRTQVAEMITEYARTRLVDILDGANEDIADNTPLAEVLDRVAAFVDSLTPAADRSPRSWSLPAPPPDDVTVVHVQAPSGEVFRCVREGHRWRDGSGRRLFRLHRRRLYGFGELLDLGDVVEGEAPALEPQGDAPVFAVGDRVRSKSGGTLGTVTEVGHGQVLDERRVSFADGWDRWVDVSDLEPVPEPPAPQPRCARCGHAPHQHAGGDVGCLDERCPCAVYQEPAPVPQAAEPPRFEITEHENVLSEISGGHARFVSDEHEDAAAWALDEIARLRVALAAAGAVREEDGGQCDDSVTLRMQLDTAVKAHAGQKAIRALVEKERDRLRARVAELEAAGSVSPDDAHTTADDTGSRLFELAHRLDDLNLDTDMDEIVTELRKIGAGLLPPLNRSRTVSTTTRTTDWEANER